MKDQMDYMKVPPNVVKPRDSPETVSFHKISTP